jgi:hypothetical protein
MAASIIEAEPRALTDWERAVDPVRVELPLWSGNRQMRIVGRQALSSPPR